MNSIPLHCSPNWSLYQTPKLCIAANREADNACEELSPQAQNTFKRGNVEPQKPDVLYTA